MKWTADLMSDKFGREPAVKPAGRIITGLLFSRPGISKQLLGVLALMTLIGILVAGLWPFRAPKNQVSWLKNENGLLFGRHGTLLSSGTFGQAHAVGGSSCTLEIWIDPERTWTTGTIIAFYDRAASRQISLHQTYTDLELQRDFEGRHPQGQNSSIFVADVFRKKEVFVTVTSNGQDTKVYIDGRQMTKSLGFGFPLEDLTGEIIVANSPLRRNSWAGKLRGLAIYRSELNAAQVAKHYEDWIRQGKPAVMGNEESSGLYLFDEHVGRIIHNRVRPEIDLYIPERYLVVNQIRLESPWKEYHTQRSYLKNAFLNLAAFVPLGFFCCAYFSWKGRVCGAAWATVALGLAVSFTIEILQAGLPTRYSGVTDLITNTLGTCIGVILCWAAASRAGRSVDRREHVAVK